MSGEVIREIVDVALKMAKADYKDALTNYPDDAENQSWCLSRVVVLQQLENTIDHETKTLDMA
jgi:hypothetical protein